MKFAALVLVTALSATAVAQPASPKADVFDSNKSASTPAAPKRPAQPDRAAPPFTSAPEVYSGFSGPGEPVRGAGLGGWRNGREGVRYKGPSPKPGRLGVPRAVLGNVVGWLTT